ncbi:hypothetical protein LCGC14_1213590 [marine sediment metagenome]|uniref:Uncharacterized protein n=1 Tax=marine sediment metagenome TaxID=412755 RepID=A0A0F9PHZ4_9ZZZZ
MTKFTEQEAKDLIVEEYVKRCTRIAEENSSDDQIVSYYQTNIKGVRLCKTFDDVMTFIWHDGDFDEDPEGLLDFLQSSLISQ